MFQRILAMLLLPLLGACGTAASQVELPGPLVSVEWLQAHRSDVNVLDVREDPAAFTGAPEFAEANGTRTLTRLGGHIPGALLLDFSRARTKRTVDGREIDHMLPDAQSFQALMRDVGVKADRPTVIVSDGTTGSDLDMAARIYWSMKVYGDDALAILDGGTAAWIEAGQPVTGEAAPGGGGTWNAGDERSALFARSDDVAGAAADGRQIIDARPLSFYLGLERKSSVKAAGHIETALDFPPEVRAEKRGGATHFLPAQKYAGVFAHLGIDPAKPAVAYCNTGHMASGAWFVLSEIMKNPDVSMYDGSMHEWAAEDRPVVGLP